MNKLIDKVIVLILCIVAYTQYKYDVYIIAPLICAIIVSAFMSYLEKEVLNLAIFLCFCVICIIYPAFLFFLPLIGYDLFSRRWKYALFIAVIPAGVGFTALPLSSCVFIILFTALSYLIKLRTSSFEKVKAEYIALRDTTKEFSLQLESKNRELMEKQDYEINLAMLNERNRISRDIHDNIGHVLSNSILQTGAMIATCKDNELSGRLDILKNTLLAGMDSVRESVHGLYDESVDLYNEVKTLTDNFHFCEISLDYDMESNPDKKIKYAVLSVIKEALSNIIKHSDATSVKITLKEHPVLYQLVVKDNGSKKETSSDGIGLRNMEQRIHSFNGILNIRYDNGFTVFISIPKEYVK